MATLTRQPNEVLTDLGDKPKPEKSAENADVKLMRGRSSATTTHDRMQARFTPLACKDNHSELENCSNNINLQIKSIPFALYL